jgi:ElaB/YqjD/DUF883 family membrane-anchored ribosome-binding protein
MTDPNPDTQKLLEDLRALVEDAERVMAAATGATAAAGSERLGEIRSRAEESLHAVRSRLQALEGNVAARAREATREAEGYVRDNPWTAVGVAAGIGLLLGVLIARR